MKTNEQVSTPCESRIEFLQKFMNREFKFVPPAADQKDLWDECMDPTWFGLFVIEDKLYYEIPLYLIPKFIEANIVDGQYIKLKGNKGEDFNKGYIFVNGIKVHSSKYLGK